MDRQTEDPITRCPWQTFQVVGIKISYYEFVGNNEHIKCFTILHFSSILGKKYLLSLALLTTRFVSSSSSLNAYALQKKTTNSRYAGIMKYKGGN